MPTTHHGLGSVSKALADIFIIVKFIIIAIVTQTTALSKV
jgi:hypothetical protein